MIYKMIKEKSDCWYASQECPIRDFIQYIIDKGMMRDAQIEAIKIYLFLKIKCNNQSLYNLFINGEFNMLNLDDEELSTYSREYLKNNLASQSLYEYSKIDNNGVVLAPKLYAQMKKEPSKVDAKEVFKKMFYDVSYSDYLFSLPMGAGKTYLMAAFIYINLYFALNEPGNKNFAHNFIIFAPSGLKSSIIPSLKTIQNFDPSWIIAEPMASKLKNMIIFELLDQGKTGKKSNRIKNPNVQKISIHQPLNKLFGFVAVTNAEKVILDRVKIEEINGQFSLKLDESEDELDRQANELRNLIGKIPSLSIFIDEVHHAATDNIKLRVVVNKWITDNNTVNGVVGFSGTPYLPKVEKIKVLDKIQLIQEEISNIVYFYPLVNGIGNFLKKPTVLISDSNERLDIVEAGVKYFLDNYLNTRYEDGTIAKLAIYCGRIKTLHEVVYPVVERIVREYNLNPSEAILKYHGDDKEYPISQESRLKYESLDFSISKVRIILLVQIGKEGWDCRSLTGVILSQEGDCPKNMVLQTCCRCLRQVKRNSLETALIYLNEHNAVKLNEQLGKQHHTTIKEFQVGNSSSFIPIKRYNRMKKVKVPEIDFYQLRIEYNTIVVDEKIDPKVEIAMAATNAKRKETIIKLAEMSDKLEEKNIDFYIEEKGKDIAQYDRWLYLIVKESFGFIDMSQLKKYETELKSLFRTITYESDDLLFFSSKYNQTKVRENIRKAFYERRNFETKEELVSQEARLLKVENFKEVVYTTDESKFFPNKKIVENIINNDCRKKTEKNISKQLLNTIKFLEESGNLEIANQLRNQNMYNERYDHTYHYIPYRDDSDFEKVFLEEVLKLSLFQKNNLEIYYNGDETLTEFRIKCYKKTNKWKYIGMYTPDFLIIKRKNNIIDKLIIVETKGRIYANDPVFIEKKKFTKDIFIKMNNKKFGYDRFSYLYLEDSLTDYERIFKTKEFIEKFMIKEEF